MTEFEKLVIVTKKTWLEELIERFNTKAQAKFYIESMGGNFKDYQDAHDQYYRSLEKLKRSIPSKIRYQVVEKEFLPNFLFNPSDLVLAIGQDGLVINIAKYLDEQRILAVNPDPSRFDGVLLPFTAEDVSEQLDTISQDKEGIAHITMIKCALNDKQTIYAVNDLFIGHYSHGSARYKIRYIDHEEDQSSSGIIVSTGAGSTAWFRSIITGAYGITKSRKPDLRITPIPNEYEYKFPWDANYLYFSVREPFVSKTSGASIVFGPINEKEKLIITSRMPESGIIFSDGIWKDYIKFNSGAIATITVADKKANLIIKS